MTDKTEKLCWLDLTLELVTTESGAKHYKDKKGNRLILYVDGSYDIEQGVKDTKPRERFPDYRAAQKNYNRKEFKDLRNVHALTDCRPDYLDACWNWLYEKNNLGS